MLAGVIVIAIVIIAFLIATYSKKDVASTPVPQKLRGDAKIINTSHEVRGSKNNRYYKTRIVFDDGFVYESTDTIREDHFLYYKIGIDEGLKEDLITRAKDAHNSMCTKHGVVLPSKPYVCGNCGQKPP